MLVHANSDGRFNTSERSTMPPVGATQDRPFDIRTTIASAATPYAVSVYIFQSPALRIVRPYAQCPRCGTASEPLVGCSQTIIPHAEDYAWLE